MLSAEHITKRYWSTRAGAPPAVDDVSLTLGERERVGLTGNSGSGKSTLAQILALVMPADQGHVAIDRVPVRGSGVRAPQSLRRQVQLIWQSPRLSTDPRLRIKQIIQEPLAACGILPKDKDERAAVLEEWRDRVGMTPDLMERFPHEVSDGQLQRACLARALVLRPRFLLCDEITSMLDVSTQASILDVIARQQQELGFGVMLISHDRILLDHWCQRTVEMADGRLHDPQVQPSLR